MRTLAHSARRAQREAGGAFLPAIFPALDARGIKARLGTATMVVGPPGAFKTGTMIYYALRLAQRGLTVLYVSADAEEFEAVERAAAAVTGDPMSSVAQDHQHYEQALHALDNIRFSYEDSPTYDELVLETCAFAEVYGAFPKVIVIDNLMNLTGDVEDEWAAMRASSRVIHKLTRLTGAAVFVLHHAADDRTDPSVPAPRKSLQGKVSQLPKAIWSIALSDDRLRICPVKNRWGRADPTGRDYVELWVDPASNRVFNSSFDRQNGVPA